MLLPGLRIHRFERPAQPRWDDIVTPSMCMIVPAAGAVVTVGGRRLDRPEYLVVGAGRHLVCRIAVASGARPVCCLVVELPPPIVRSVSADMRRSGTPLRQSAAGEPNAVTAPSAELVDAVERLIGSASNARDRTFLTPLRLHELIYRVLQGDQGGRLLAVAAHQALGNPVAAALDFIASHLADPLTVDTLAQKSCLSSSAFSRAFREVTGQSPYQYVKEARIDRARALLDERPLGVAEVSRAVGYTSVSHFIKGFRDRFGVTPGDYADRVSLGRYPVGCPDCGSTAASCVVAS